MLNPFKHFTHRRRMHQIAAPLSLTAQVIEDESGDRPSNLEDLQDTQDIQDLQDSAEKARVDDPIPTLPTVQEPDPTASSPAPAPTNGSLEPSLVSLLQAIEERYEAQQWEMVIDLCGRVLQLNPQVTKAHKRLGNARQALGQLAAAMTHYAQALTLQPDYAEVHANLGSLYAQQQQWQKAIAAYQKAIELQPDFAGAYRNLAKIWSKLGSTQVAAECWYQALNLEPATATPAQLLNLGNDLLRAGRTAQAITCYRWALQLDDGFAAAHFNLANALKQQEQWQEAATHYQLGLDLSAEKLLAPPPSAAEVRPEPSEIVQDDRVQAALAQANQYADGQQWEAAIALVHDAIQLLEPQMVTAYSLLATALRAQQCLPDAVECCQKIVALQPQVPQGYANLGGLYAQQQQWQRAIACYQTALRLDPKFAGAYRNLARALEQTQQLEAANDAWYEALMLDPAWASAEVALNLGQQLVTARKLKAAVDCYRLVTQHHPQVLAAFHHLGKLLVQQGRLAEAIACYREAVSHHPADATAYFELGQLLARAKDESVAEAIACLQRATQLNPTFSDAFQKLGELFQQQQDWAAAAAAYERVVALQPQTARAHHLLGEIRYQQQRWPEAIAAYQQAIALRPEFSWSHHNLGDTLLRVQRWDEAAVALRQAIALHPAFAWSHYNLGEALIHLKDWDGAIAAYRRALDLQPDLPLGQAKLAEALQYRAQADQQAAIALYQQAITRSPDSETPYHGLIQLQPKNVEGYLGLAHTLSQQGRLDEAIVYYQTARQLRPDRADIQDWLDQTVERQSRLKPLLAQSFKATSEFYRVWIEENEPTPADVVRMMAAIAQFTDPPLISIVMPVYNTPAAMLREAIQSVQAQIYPHWELCIADDASPQPHVRAILEEYAAGDRRIKITYRTENGHISACSNSALELATGDFVALLDHDDCLSPYALYEVANLLQQHPEADLIYSDEDKLTPDYQRTDPFFKPDWCPDNFLSRMYTCHLGTYRRSLLLEIGGFRVGYEGSQDYDLVLRFTEKSDRIFHIPKILYHWRIHPGSVTGGAEVKPYAYEAAVRSLTDALQRRGEPGRVIMNAQYPGFYTIRYELKATGKVSIIIPTRNLGQMVNACLKSIFERSTYANFEVVLLDNGSDDPETLAILQDWKTQEPERFRYCRYDVPFNYSHINNYAVTQAQGDYLLFLNNDTEVITPDWLEGMVEQAQRPSIGAVGATLFYEDDTIQHAGVIVGIGGIAGHSHKGARRTDVGYFATLIATSNYAATTGACLMCRREVFEAVGGFDETLAVAFNDVDLCLKMGRQGYRNVVLPHVQLYHYESKSRGYEDTPEKVKRFQREATLLKQRWGDVIAHDPCYSPNLTRDREDFSLRVRQTLNVLEKALYSPDAQLISGFSIDTPQPGRLPLGTLTVQGWVIGGRSPAETLRIFHGNQVIQTMPVNHPRPDVARVFPAIPQAATSGFVVPVNVLDLPHETRLELDVVLEDGSSAALGSIHFSREMVSREAKAGH
ncbi:MAG: tetratricopeptide repeat protein [Synechococcales bacterium]|nr:tetratricopeptide repeat protein [Synechococcales bacterium]